jgi:hypothetical protein
MFNYKFITTFWTIFLFASHFMLISASAKPLLTQAKASKAAPSLCKGVDKTIFSCPFKNGKTVSICASADISRDAGHLQYRFGKLGQVPELVFPAKRQGRVNDYFWFYPNGFDTSSPDNVWADPVRTLGFKHKAMVYELEVTANKGTAEYFAELRVKRGSARGAADVVLSMDCPLTRATNHIYDLQALDMPFRPSY